MDIVTYETGKSKKNNDPRSQLTAPGIILCIQLSMVPDLSHSIVFWTHPNNHFCSYLHDPVFWTHPKSQLAYLNFSS